MLIDAHSVADKEIIETEVCIVGSGPAGITLAREFAGLDFRVCLLESGGLDTPEPDIATLTDVETQGNFVQVKPGDRNVQLGGNSNSWAIQINKSELGLRLCPLDEVDFEERNWLPYSGWPFDRNYLLPYYERAHRMFRLKDLAYTGKDWETAQAPQLPFRDGRVTTKIFQFGPGAAFSQDYLREIKQATNITIYTHASVTELETDETGQTVERVQVTCLGGKQFSVTAKIIILATGGVGAAHLLLLSDRVQRMGLGNDYDLVGRFFMDHPLVTGGYIIPKNPQVFKQAALYDLRSVSGTSVMGALGLTNNALRHEQVLNTAAWLFPRSRFFRPSKAVASLKSLLSRDTSQGSSEGGLHHLRNIVSGLDDIAAFAYDKVTRKAFYPHLFAGGWSEQEHPERMYDVFEVLFTTEQAPHPDNRVTLTDEVDALGRRKAQMQTRWRELEMESIKRSQDILAEEIKRIGLGHYVIDREEGLPVLERGGTAHHMGTTRMHIDPRQGVVDPNCRVHSVSNLYIASSSVFPTGGYANPTLTVVALALRLADQVKTMMASPVSLLSKS